MWFFFYKIYKIGNNYWLLFIGIFYNYWYLFLNIEVKKIIIIKFEILYLLW